MTAVLSSAPGPLQLLPGPEYGMGWLQIVENGKPIASLPQKDPYSEIYTVRGKWWGLCEERLINPLATVQDAKARDNEWNKYALLIRKEVKEFHTKVANKYHPLTHAFYGSDKAFLSFGQVRWVGNNSGLASPLPPGCRTRPLDGHTPFSELSAGRTVHTPVDGLPRRKYVMQSYLLAAADEPGDGTVPYRSGVAPKPHVQSLLRVKAEHEPAYQKCPPARHFTLRAIVQLLKTVAPK